jgi:16S rRNA (guanine966-N2)-methyltransferase
VLKITSGVHRGRLIQSPPGFKTRPTSERVRQAWLNCLQIQLPDSRILDLFSGSGALGLEALSRGAGYALFIEENAKVAQLIQQNAKTLGLQDQSQVWVKRAEACLPLLLNEAPFDFVFMDPPYEKGFEEKILATFQWQTILTESGKLCIESAHRKQGGFTPPPTLKIVRDEKYGDTQLTFYMRCEQEAKATVPTENNIGNLETS